VIDEVSCHSDDYSQNQQHHETATSEFEWKEQQLPQHGLILSGTGFTVKHEALQGGGGVDVRVATSLAEVPESRVDVKLLRCG